jgi:hypothetical protein
MRSLSSQMHTLTAGTSVALARLVKKASNPSVLKSPCSARHSIDESKSESDRDTYAKGHIIEGHPFQYRL